MRTDAACAGEAVPGGGRAALARSPAGQQCAPRLDRAGRPAPGHGGERLPPAAGLPDRDHHPGPGRGLVRPRDLALSEHRPAPAGDQPQSRPLQPGPARLRGHLRLAGTDPRPLEGARPPRLQGADHRLAGAVQGDLHGRRRHHRQHLLQGGAARRLPSLRLAPRQCRLLPELRDRDHEPSRVGLRARQRPHRRLDRGLYRRPGVDQLRARP